MKVSYLGPAGTYNEEALLACLENPEGRDGSAPLGIELAPQATIFDAVNAVESGAVERGLVPFENSIEGSVRATLDALAFDTSRVMIVGEHDHPIRHSLIARRGTGLEDITVVLSHPQANAQCARFIRETLPQAEVRAMSSTGDAILAVAGSEQRWAALGSARAGLAQGCVVLREGVEDASDNVTRFVWLAAGDVVAESGAQAPDGWRSTLVFSELGEDRPGALVEALLEFSSRGVNMTRIESRPLRRGLGRYLFFADVSGDARYGVTAEAITALRGKAESVRILGSYRLGAEPPL